MFSFCIIIVNFSLMESFSKYSSLVKIVLIKATMPVLHHMSPATAKIGACSWTSRKMRMARYCIESILGSSGYP